MEKTNEKIMVIDDEIHILHIISLKLRNAGYEVITAQDGQEALETIQVELPDLIITDYQMPYLSGLELCQRLKQIPSTRHIPAIMLTARGFDLDATDMQETGITTCINKPFGPRELLRIVKNTLSLEGATAC
ncbi:MAG: response regulator [Phycisphaerae bacterium]|nr:response regulator [Phycisphaerae bacterium]